ncbi:pantetheinase-like [Pollicipes pollicipes]|uniref:pantetheinase-like n=1 Tax=Pollicipes pollicipes TaxID=41117 RepID=UPI001885905E|nr:pantetheinase-like [Pollicipes pollicipes]
MLLELALGLAALATVAAAGPSELALDVRPVGLAPVPPRPYITAVCETAPADWDSRQGAPWRQNMKTVRRRAEEASAQGADLLVLAEHGIMSNGPFATRETLALFAAEMPSADELAVPCGDASRHEVVSGLSCLAKTHQMYIVANYVEKVPCSQASDAECPADDFYLFNTNLVFDRNGTVIQKYHKVHPFGIELRVLQTPQPHLAAFRTDFGVVFGLMTCFDILFEVPAVEMTRRGISHVVFPTDWGDELPSLTALQMHSAWARGLGVTLLSAGLHLRKTASVGSGIYTAAGALNYTYDYASEDGALVTARVPVDGPAQPPAGFCSANGGGGCRQPVVGDDAYYPVQHYNVSEFASAELTGREQELCHGQLCCRVSVRDAPPAAAGDARATYRLLAYDGRRNFAPHWSTEICVVTLCAGPDQASCSWFPSGPTPPIPPFTLSGTFRGDTTVYPSAVRTHMQLAADWDFDRATRHLSVDNTDALLSAQLYGRNFARDLP